VSKRDFHDVNKTNNQYTYGGSVHSKTSSLQVRSEWNPWVDYNLFKHNGKEMWASVTFVPTRQTTNTRTEAQIISRHQCSEFGWNGTSELIWPCSNRMARKCEQAWLSCYQDKQPIHVQRCTIPKEVSAPSSVGMEPLSWLVAVKTEWQGIVSKRDFHDANKTNNKCTYRDTD
jgi:hypothetical protein